MGLEPVKLSRCSTGVPGLDAVLGGGLPRGHLHLLQGAPGTGKTTVALHFLREGARHGERGLYLTLSQTGAELAKIAESHGWPLDGIRVEEVAAADPLDGADARQSVLHTADVELGETIEAIRRAVEEADPERLVYDSLLEVRYLSDSTLGYRRELIGLKRILNARGCTALFIDSEAEFGGDKQLEGLAHGVVTLERELPEYGVARRRVQVKKMRGTPVLDGYHDLAIRTGGMEVFPRIVPELTPERTGRRELLGSGVPELDEMLGGGLEEGTTALIVGHTGTGKSTLAASYVHAACERGQGAAAFLFEERPETFLRRCEDLGLLLRPHVDAGRLQVVHFNPAEVSPGEFSQRVRRAVDEDGVRVLVIDSLSGYLNAMTHGQSLIKQLHALLNHLTRRGALTLLIVAQHGLVGQAVQLNFDVSTIADSVLLLRQYEATSAIRRTVSVIKKRYGPHAPDIRALEIGPEGVSVREFDLSVASGRALGALLGHEDQA